MTLLVFGDDVVGVFGVADARVHSRTSPGVNECSWLPGNVVVAESHGGFDAS